VKVDFSVTEPMAVGGRRSRGSGESARPVPAADRRSMSRGAEKNKRIQHRENSLSAGDRAQLLSEIC